MIPFRWELQSVPMRSEHKPEVPEWPVHVREISIRNLRIFEDFELRFHPVQNGSGQWALLLGDNGVGKTTILRSLVLNLVFELGDTLLQLGGPSAPFLRHGCLQGEVGVTLQIGDRRGDRHVLIRPGARGIEDIGEGPARFTDAGLLAQDRDLPIYAYGCQRGTALGGPSRKAEFKPLDDVLNLFDDTARLIHAETWLKDLRLAALEDGRPSMAFFEAVLEALINILDGVGNIDVTKDGVFFEGPGVDRAPLAALSDGYITTAGWVIDLIARWTDRCRRAGVKLDGRFCSRMKGLVLIDEIDLHLHPRWQLKVVSTLREQFPGLSFIATTHNPLTLLGAQAGEIHILQRDNGHVRSIQRDIPPGARADQVLTGDWFGLVSTVDRDTLELLDRHRQLLRQGVPRDDPQRQELEDELRHRLGTFEDTSIDRMVQSIAAELLPPDSEDLSAEQRQALREKIRERAREKKRAAGAA